MNEVQSRVVVGADPSVEGEAAMRVAMQEAVLRGLPLVAVRAWSDALVAGYPMGALLPESSEQAQQAARAAAEELVKAAREHVPGADGVDVGVRALRGAPGAVLVAASQDAELLVVGTRAAGALSRTVLGSVAEHVVHHAACPVVVVPAAAGRAAAGDAPAGRVLVGVDHEPESLLALAWAADAAVARGAVLVPLLVREGEVTGSLTDLEAAERRSLRDAVPARPGLRVEPDVLVGRPGRALVGAATARDLLVVGTRGRNAAVGALLGSTSTAVLRHAPCPVAVVRGD